MRGGLERWKRGVESQGVRQAMAYAFKGSCDSHLRSVTGVEALAAYSGGEDARVSRFTVDEGTIGVDGLDAAELRRWVDGHDPFTDEPRGRELSSPHADLILDGTINAPKSYSIAALLNPDLSREFEELQDRLRTRIISTWQRELNARRGAGGRIRESLRCIEVVELQHRRSRALDPHIHRHLWLNVKVLGVDGKWSNVDSRVAMKMHTLINAEGELAARTDPVWIGALARHGFSLDENGEIAELTTAVRPLSRRSNQIEANRAKFLLEWRSEHQGQEPDHDVLRHIDRLSWAKNRPDKPGVVDETEWEELVRGELRALDPTLPATRSPRSLAPVRIADLDRELLASRAVVDADGRSTANGGRFSSYDVRAGATRAIAASGVVAPREHLQELIDDVTARALAHTIDLLAEEPDRPAHIKGFMAATTAALKVELAARFDELTAAGATVDEGEILLVAGQELGKELALDPGQVRAAAAIAGTDRLVSVTGPAGAGKTTMLRIAERATAAQGRRFVVVAPTKKAASVAGREIGATAASLHALLADYGWRWGRDDAGADIWHRLSVGDLDPRTGQIYSGPRRFVLAPRDRIVVDEGGMVDLHSANALSVVAAETGAGIAMVGDHLQAMPVGHAGAMACMTRRATAVAELTAVHRFRDPGYAALTLRMREPESKEHALVVACDLDARGAIRRVANTGEARAAMVEGYFRYAASRRRVALVTSTNDEADAINEAIQERRIALGQLRQDRLAVGRDEQRLLEGDVVQTRLNDRVSDVENRAMWTIRRIGDADIELVALGDSGDIRRVPLDYAAEHMHLAYASTVHGIQGETTDASIVGPGVDASGLYVGMTRGRSHNEAVAIAWDQAGAREQIADSMMRGALEVSVEDSVRAARAELGRAARDVLHHEWTTAQGSAQPTDRLQRADEIVDWLERSRSTLVALEARIAADEAEHHGRGSTADRDLTPTHALLAEHVAEQEALLLELERNSARRSSTRSSRPAHDRDHEQWSRPAPSASTSLDR